MNWEALKRYRNYIEFDRRYTQEQMQQQMQTEALYRQQQQMRELTMVEAQIQRAEAQADVLQYRLQQFLGREDTSRVDPDLWIDLGL